MDNKTTIYELMAKYSDFCNERNWTKFHNPKDLAIGISTEANELLELFRFKNTEESIDFINNNKDKIEEEIADILLFTLRFAELNKIDLSDVVYKKMAKNELKYPINKAKGSNKKYNEFD